MEHRQGQELRALGAGLLGMPAGAGPGGEPTPDAGLDAREAEGMDGEAAGSAGKLRDGLSSPARRTGACFNIHGPKHDSPARLTPQGDASGMKP